MSSLWEQAGRLLMEKGYLEVPLDSEDPPFVLASGQTSYEYFACDQALSDGPTLALVGSLLYGYMDDNLSVVGGPAMGAIPLSLAMALEASRKGEAVQTFFVRKEPKKHGIQCWDYQFPNYIEGGNYAGQEVALVEDVVTSGYSALEAMNRCRDAGMFIKQVIALIDREEGGMERIQNWIGRTGKERVIAVYRYSDLKKLV